MNKDEYGVVFQFLTGYDMSGQTGLAINFTKPSGLTLAVANPLVTLGTAQVTVLVNTSVVTFPANQYVNFTFRNGDVNEAGAWKARVVYNDATRHLISDSGSFTVGP